MKLESREIKFRVWDKSHKHMITDIDLFDSIEQDESLRTFFNGWKVTENNIILMQYTGLKDKHGKEIYEGDRVSFWFEDVIFKGTVSGEIEWCNALAQFMILLPEHEISISIAALDLSFAELEVIGNVCY